MFEECFHVAGKVGRFLAVNFVIINIWFAEMMDWGVIKERRRELT